MTAMHNMRSFLIALLVLTLFGASSAWSQLPEENRAKAAEQAGRLREALAAYTTVLQGTAEGGGDEQRLSESIIALARRLSPPPAIPEEARRFSVRAHVWVKEAKSPSDFEEAAKEFAKALRIAPWWSDAYLNQGVVLEKAGKYDAAVRSFKLYLLASPAAADADKVRDQIYAIEVRKEMAAKDRTAAAQEQQRKKQQEEARASDPSRIAGDWCQLTRSLPTEPLEPWCHQGFLHQVRLSGNVFEIWVDYGTKGRDTGLTRLFSGTISGDELSGSNYALVYYASRCPAAQPYPMQGRVTEGGKRIEMTYTYVTSINDCYSAARSVPGRTVLVRRPTW